MPNAPYSYDFLLHNRDKDGSSSGASSAAMTAVMSSYMPVADAYVKEVMPAPRSAAFVAVVLRAAVALLAIVQVLFMSNQFQFNAKMTDRVSNVFIGLERPGYNAKNELIMHSSDEVASHLEYVVQTYNHLEDFFPTSIKDGQSLTMTLTKLKHHSYKNIIRSDGYIDLGYAREKEEVEFNLTADCILGPFDPSNCHVYNGIAPKDLWWWTDKIKLTVRLRNVYMRGWYAAHQPLSMLWSVGLEYDMSQHNMHDVLSWRVDLKTYADLIPSYSAQSVMLILMLFVAVLLTLYDGLVLLKGLEVNRRWTTLQLVTSAGNGLTAGLFLYNNVVTGQEDASFHSFLTTLSSVCYFLAWVVLTKEAGHLTGTSIPELTSICVPAALRAGVPLFITVMALAASGCYFFGARYSHFSTVGLAFELLFSLAVGDAIFDTFNGVYDSAQNEWVRHDYLYFFIPFSFPVCHCVPPQERVFARVYVYAVVGWMYWLVLNQFFIVMEDAYACAKEAEQRGVWMCTRVPGLPSELHTRSLTTQTTTGRVGAGHKRRRRNLEAFVCVISQDFALWDRHLWGCARTWPDHANNQGEEGPVKKYNCGVSQRHSSHVLVWISVC